MNKNGRKEGFKISCRTFLLWGCFGASVLMLSSSLLPSVSSTGPVPYALNYPANFGQRFTVPEDNPMTDEGVGLGRMLFYETKLSSSNTISCATCHQQELAFTDGKALSTGVDGAFTQRNAMSLTNLLWVRNFFWDGRAGTLEEQSVFPLTDSHEMGQSLETSIEKLHATATYPTLFQNAFGSPEVTEERITKAIAQFERTLISANSKYDQYLRGEYTPSNKELRGLALFSTSSQPDKNILGANCAHCHGGPKTYIELFHNNGLDTYYSDRGREGITDQPSDRGRFRVPTLRNIALTAPYMHDGRFHTLEEVVDHYSDQVRPGETLSPFITQNTNETGGTGLLLTAGEKEELISFLHLLTDEEFVNNPAFSDPKLSQQRISNEN